MPCCASRARWTAGRPRPSEWCSPASRSGSGALPYWLRTPPFAGGTSASTSSTPRATPTLAVRWSGCCPWWTRCCWWWMPWMAPCPRPALSPRRPSSAACSPLSWSTRWTGPGPGPTGWWTRSSTCSTAGEPLFQAIVDLVPPPAVDPDGPFQMQISALDYSSYVGVIGIGRVTRGRVQPHQQVVVLSPKGGERRGRVGQVMTYLGLQRQEAEQAFAGDILCITGIDELSISDTLCDPEHPERLPALTVDEPTVSMTFQVNDSPLAGQDGKYVTSRNLRERLERELIHNVALRVEETDSPDQFKVSGRGELHLSVLIEAMRREGYELGVSRPEVIVREVEGVRQEPYEELIIDVEETHQGAIMEELGQRKGRLTNMQPDGKGRVRLDYMIPSRGLIGFRNQFMTLTSGTGILTSRFDHYGEVVAGEVEHRNNGVLVSMCAGRTLAFALFNLQERGRMLVGPGVEVYEGMIVGIHARGNDLVVNPTRAKKLDNMRASGADESIILTPPVQFSLEQALEFRSEERRVEVTPQHIRLRKRLLKEHERKRAGNR